jgi:glutamate synthase domain-containing protein 1
MRYIASEEAAIRVIEPEPDRVWMARGGEPLIFTLENAEVAHA